MLRDYQSAAVAEITATLAREQSVCAVLPTGAGKTVIGSAVVGQLSKRTVWLAHRNELLDQAAAQLRRWQAAPVGVILRDQETDPSAPIQVASIQTLVARLRKGSPLPKADLVVWDEAHHAKASQWLRLLQEDYCGAKLLGLTATPERADGQALGDIFGALVAPVRISELIKGGHLVPAHTLVPGDGYDVDPVSAYAQHAPGSRAVLFASNVEGASAWRDAFLAAGVPSATVHGGLKADERAQVIADFRSGAVRVLTNYAIITEGFDLPDIECVILDRDFGHVGQYLQAVGRGLRPAAGKTKCVVIDCKGSSKDHQSADIDRVFSLEGRAIRPTSPDLDDDEESESIPTFRRIWHTLQRRGYLVELQAPTADEWQIRSIDRTLLALPPVERSYYEESLTIALQRGWKLGAAGHRFKEKFGYLPWQRRAA